MDDDPTERITTSLPYKNSITNQSVFWATPGSLSESHSLGTQRGIANPAQNVKTKNMADRRWLLFADAVSGCNLVLAACYFHHLSWIYTCYMDTYGGSILCRRFSVFRFSSASCDVLSSTKLSKLFAYFSNMFTMLSIMFVCLKRFQFIIFSIKYYL